MKRKINAFIIIFILSICILPKLSHASVVLSASSVASTSATLNATGLQNNTGVIFNLHSNINYPNTPFYLETNTETSGGTGQATSLFSGLIPNGHYVATINYVGQNPVIGNYIFSTPKLTTSGLSVTAVTLDAIGVIPNKEVGFRLISTAAISVYDTTLTTTSSSSGTASITFSNPPLTESTPYKATMFYTDNSSLILSEVTFTTGSSSTYTALVTPLDVTSTSATLMAENLDYNTTIVLGVVNKNSGITPYESYQKTTTDNIGRAYADFLGLNSGEEYVGSVYYEGDNTVIGSATFSTLPGKSVVMRDLTETSVAFLASGFPPNKEISFNVENYNSSTPKYTNPQDFTTDESGIALFQFYGLSPGGEYKYYHSEAPGKVGTFSTFGDPVNPDPGSGGNDNGGTYTSDEGGLVPCGTTRNPRQCEFKDILTLINTVINFLLFVMAIPIAAIMFAYAGFMLVFSGGASEKRSKAKSIFINVAIGLIVVAAAWLIVHTILSIVGFDGSWIGL